MVLSEAQQTSVLEAIAGGARVKDVCAVLGTSDAALWTYRKKHPAFGAAFEDALVESCDVEMERLRDLAFEAKECPLPGLARVRESAARILMWYIARRAPHKYGDRVALDVNGKLDLGAVLALADARLNARRLEHDITPRPHLLPDADR